MIPKKNVHDLIFKHSNLEKELASGELEKKFLLKNQKSLINEVIKC